VYDEFGALKSGRGTRSAVVRSDLGADSVDDTAVCMPEGPRCRLRSMFSPIILVMANQSYRGVDISLLCNILYGYDRCAGSAGN
jgi:hypothetical protein